MANIRKSVKKNYTYNLLFQMFTILLPLITTPYISRILGASGIGTYSYTTAIVSYFVLVANLGSSYYGGIEISYQRDNLEQKSRLFWDLVALRLLTTTVCLISYFWVFRHSEYKNIFYIQSLTLVSVCFDISWFFTGMEEFGITVRRSTIIKVVSLAFIFIFVKDSNDVPIYVLSLAGASLMGNMSFWFYVPKYLKKVSIKEINPFRHIKGSFQLFIPFMATQIYTALDKTMIRYFSSTTVENGYYEQAEKIVKMLLTVLTTMGTVMSPRFAYLYKNNNWNEIKRYLRKSFSFVWILAIPMCLGLIAVSESFVPWFFGEGFEAVMPLLKIFSLLVILIGISNLLGCQYLIPTGRQNIYTITVVSGAVLNAGLNCILVPKFLSVGAAIASVAAEMLIMIIQIVILRKEISLRAIFGTAQNYAIAGFIMFIVLWTMKGWVASTIIGTMSMVAVGIIVYGVILLLLRDKFLFEYINLILKKIRIK